jgi:hypothetical protein
MNLKKDKIILFFVNVRYSTIMIIASTTAIKPVVVKTMHFHHKTSHQVSQEEKNKKSGDLLVQNVSVRVCRS